MTREDVICKWFADDGTIPNNPDLPVVILPAAQPADAGAGALRRLHARNGWGGTWTGTVFNYHHWHPDAHEALSVATGTAEIMLGGPGGETFRLSAGDTVILPAGTGHCRISASEDFAVCGAYPPGQEDYTILRATAGDRARGMAQIRQVARPKTDPLQGASGPLLRAWG